MSRKLDATWFSRNVYSKAMGQNILNIYRRIMRSPPPSAALTPSSTRPSSPSQAATWVHPIARPDSRLFKHVDTLAKMKRPLLREIDECIVREVGGNTPPFPFESAESYYEWASPKHKIEGIRMCASFPPSFVGQCLMLNGISLLFPRQSYALHQQRRRPHHRPRLPPARPVQEVLARRPGRHRRRRTPGVLLGRLPVLQGSLEVVAPPCRRVPCVFFSCLLAPETYSLTPMCACFSPFSDRRRQRTRYPR